MFDDLRAWFAGLTTSGKVVVAAVVLIVPLNLIGGSAGGGSDVPDDPIAQMAIAFEGDHSTGEIRPVVDQILRTWSLPVTDVERAKIGDVAVVLRREYGIPEMELLRYTLCSGRESTALEVQDTMAFAVTFIQAGDACRR